MHTGSPPRSAAALPRPSPLALASVTGGALTALAVLLPPVLYFFLSFQFAAGHLEAEAALDRQALTAVIDANPALWAYQRVRLSEMLAQRPREGMRESRRVLDGRGAVVAESLEPLPRPRLARSLPLFDAGREVGTIEVSWSLRPLLLRSALAFLALLPLGLLALHLLRTVTLRAIGTSQRLEEQLLQAQKMEAVGRLASGVAHEFNNILSAIRGYAGMILEELPAGAPQRPDLQEILDATERARTVTRSLLVFSSRQAFEPVPVEVGPVLSRAGRLLRPLLREEVGLQLDLPGEPLWALADSLQLEQVLLNLVTNARDATPPGGRITVSAAPVQLGAEEAREAGLERSGPYARISVADTGAGIDPAIQSRIFDPFFTTKQIGKGTGLGLAIVYGIVRQHGGAIRLESEPGRGATFTVLLPAVAPGAVDEAPGSARPGSRGDPGTVLAGGGGSARRTTSG